MESEGQILGSVGWAGSTQVPGPAWAPTSLLQAFALLTIGRPCTGRDCDCEGSFMLRAGATSHLAHVLARVSRGDMVESQQGAMSLPEEEEKEAIKGSGDEGSFELRLRS